MSSRTISECLDFNSPTMQPRSFQAFSFDRYIPFRPNLNVDCAHLKVISPNRGNSNNSTKRTKSCPCPMQTDSENYNMYLNAALLNDDDEKVLPLTYRKSRKHSSLTPPWQIDIDDVFFPSSPKSQKRKLVTSPSRVLDMTGLRNDLSTNILDWNCNNYMAVSLRQTVYIWNAGKGTCRRIKVNFGEQERAFLTALSWDQSGKSFAVGTNGGEVLLLDAEQTKLLISFRSSEQSHISALDWNEGAFCSGSVAGNICLHDERQPTEKVTYIGRHRSMFNLKFSQHNYLASAGNDGVVNIWDIRKLMKCNKIEAHTVTKALSWCPWWSNAIATGGYDEDGSIKIWHATTARLLSQTKVNSKICSLIWATEYKELVTGFAGPNMKNEIAIWKCQNMTSLDLVGTLCQHERQPLHLAISPSGTTLDFYKEHKFTPKISHLTPTRRQPRLSTELEKDHVVNIFTSARAQSLYLCQKSAESIKKLMRYRINSSAGSDEIMCLWDCFPPTHKGSEDIFSPLSLTKTIR